jgi:hypothetical protein
VTTLDAFLFLAEMAAGTAICYLTLEGLLGAAAWAARRPRAPGMARRKGGGRRA